MPTIRVHCRKAPYDIYCGRPAQRQFAINWGFGNPFVIGVDGDRAEVINKFKIWLTTGDNGGNIVATEERRQWILNNLPTLVGKTLGCFCHEDQDCHCDVLIELATK